MLVPLNWLRQFVPYEGEPQALGDKLTMLGLELDALVDPFESIADIVVGHVVECERHPEAEKLSVCSVDVGDEALLTIVCGAPNVAKGQKVPVARIGCTLPDGLKIKKAKLRGVKSEGMICSERELALSDLHEGILVLPEDLRVGDRFVDALGLERTVFDFDITPNRADCLSILGFARETALAFDLPLTMPELNLVEAGGEAASEVKIIIDDPELCPLYQARVIKGVKTGQAPDWMRYRLLAVGQRPLGNIVDVTNYIMFELGQPLHAFDLDTLAKSTIRVAPAEDGMEFTTLDGQARKLLSSDLLIWDGEKPVGLAGVMGGLNSEMTDGSSNVLLEAAVFRPGTIRKTARRLALPSDASYRFERGVDQVMNTYAMNRAAQLMQEAAGGEVLSGIVRQEPLPWQSREIRFRRQRSNALLGIDLDHAFCRKNMELMGCEVDDSNADDWKVRTPSHRLDLEREADLYEEMGRVYGMDRIPAVLPRIPRTFDSAVVADTTYGFIRKIKHWAAGVGLREAVNYSFVGTHDLDLLGLPQEGRVMIANPLSEDQNVMRTEIAPGLLNTLRHNLSQGNTRLRVFEVAKSFVKDADSDTGTAESNRLGFLCYGNRFAEDWPWQKGDVDYMDVKGLVEELLSFLKLGTARFALEQEHPFLEPSVTVTLGETFLGRIGMVRPDVADKCHANKEVWLAELELDTLRTLWMENDIQFSELPKFPPSRRDVTFTCPVTLPVGSIEEAIAGAGEQLLESVEMVALFVPEDGSDERKVSFRLTYRNPKKTLKDKQVDKAHKGIVDHVVSKLSVRI